MKTRQFEGLFLEYRLQVENNPGADYDGQAFARWEGEKRVFHVLLNRAYFEREAREIFDRLSKSPPAKAGMAAPPGPFDLDGLAAGRIPIAALRALQIRLENEAWRELHARAIAAHGRSGQARRAFVQGFTQTRLACIEEHEVSHLLDLARGGDIDSPAFVRETELRAFYAELARGGNPLDSMSQALAGLLEEVRRGQTVDYSREKVVTVLRFLRESPELRPNLASPPSAEAVSEFSGETLVTAGSRLLTENGPRRSL